MIWLFPAATGLGHAMVNTRLRYPARKSTSPDMVKQLWEWAVVQAESMAETGIVTGLLAAPLLGVVTEEDADSAVVVDMARNILGNPYEDEEDDAGEEGGGSGTDRPAALPSAGPQGPSAGGLRGVTGVDQVGGGPVGDLENGDQKLGRGEDSSTSPSSPSPPPSLSSPAPVPELAPAPVPDAPGLPATGAGAVNGAPLNDGDGPVDGSEGTTGVPETGVAPTSDQDGDAGPGAGPGASAGTEPVAESGGADSGGVAS